MPRKIGSKNKSKFISVPLEQLIEKFNKNALIKVSSEYQVLFDEAQEIELLSEPGKKANENEKDFEMTVF